MAKLFALYSKYSVFYLRAHTCDYVCKENVGFKRSLFQYWLCGFSFRDFVIDKWIKGKLALFDLGYYVYSNFVKIHRHGGYFVSRLKTLIQYTLTRLSFESGLYYGNENKE